MKSLSESVFSAIYFPCRARKKNCGKDSCFAVLFSVFSCLSRRSVGAKGDVSRAKSIIILALFSGLVGFAEAAEIYYTNRTYSAVEFNITGTPTAIVLYTNALRLTNIVRGANITTQESETYGIEREPVTVGYGSASAAWEAAVQLDGQEWQHPGKIFDNVGWVRGTGLYRGEWGAYLWTLQNRIAFKPSESNWWKYNNGVPVQITNVIVGSLGIYPPVTPVVDIGPDLSPATNFPGAGQSEAREFYADITNVFYVLVIPYISITPRYEVRCVGGSNVQYAVTGTNIPNGVTWSIIPSGVGAEIYPSNDWHYAGVTPGNIATNYKVRATSIDNTNFDDEVDLTVLKVDIVETNVYLGGISTAELHLTPESSTNVQWEILPALSNGASIEGASVGTSVVIKAGALITNYTVKAYAVDLTNCFDTCTVTVFKVEIAMDGNRDGIISFGNTNDNHYLFWVNDDVDIISGGEEDDAESGTINSSDDVITCKRDLEDFARLYIKVDDSMTNLTGITYFLKFENVASDSPSANIFEAIDESSAYLSDTNIADQQIQKTKLLTATTTEWQLPNQYIKTGNQVSLFILEGKSAGRGDLTIIVKKDGKEIGKKAVNLDLRPITEFYEKYVVTVIADDNVNTNSGSNANLTTYAPENDRYVLYVHGWNMADWEKNRWTETVFKRLWWQNYKGHVGGFQWPTLGSLYYDRSEFRAWNSALALNDRITSLNNAYPGQIRVIAHSMGNVVMGEALRMFSSRVVHTYIAAQAAIPAHFYDNAVSNYWPDFNTPNIYARYSSGLTSDIPYLAVNSSHAGNMASYFNTNDYALGWWEPNNETKPDLNYYYTEGDGNIDSYAPASGDRFYYDSILLLDERTMTIPDNRFEIFARIVESRSKTLGQEPSVAGFGIARNLKEWGYDKERYSHSREFRSNIVAEKLFWEAVVEDAGLTR